MTEYKVHRVNFVEPESQAVNCLALEDTFGRRLAVCREDGSIEIWNTRSSKFWTVDFVVPSKIGRSIDSATWCNGRFFTSGLEGDVTEWDLGRLMEKHVVDACGGPVWCLANNPLKTHLAAGCEDGSVRLFDIQMDGIFLESTLDRQECRVLSLAWSKCGNIVVTGSIDSTIRVYDVKSKRIISRISTDNHRQRNTMIWSMALAEDMTIVTGDSIGQTQFWDLVTGTLLQSFHAHAADVLTLCMNENEDTVYSCGIDSRIAEFKYIRGKEEGSGGEWKLTKKLYRSVNHDIRSLCLVGRNFPRLVAAGVDPRITKFQVCRKEVGYGYLEVYPASPPYSFAKDANILLFHERNIVHLWKLPQLSGNPSGKISHLPFKLVELTSSKDDYIVCADVSSDGSMIAYADKHSVSVFRITKDTTSGSRQVSLKKVKVPQKHLKEIQKLKLTSDASKLMFASTAGIGVMSLTVDDMPVNFMEIDNEVNLPWRLFEIDSTGSHIACMDDSTKILIYSAKDHKLVSKVPNLDCCPMAMKFQPDTTFLCFVCSGKELHQYDYSAEKFNRWCLKLTKSNILYRLPKPAANFNGMAFNATDSSIVFLSSDQGFVKVKIGGEATEATEVGSKRKHEDPVESNVSSSTDYSMILYLDVSSENSLVVVEQPLNAVLNSLPPALKLKQFGT